MNNEHRTTNNTDNHAASRQAPFVSIIIPTWRNRQILQRCVDSLLAQEYPKDKFEIILVSQEDLSHAGQQGVRSVRIASGVNYAEARNIGAAQSRGEFLAFVDDDCVIPPAWLDTSVGHFLRNPHVACIGGPALPFENDAFAYRIGGYVLSSPFAAGIASARYRKGSRTIPTRGEHLIMANNIVRREAFESVSGLYPAQIPCEDGYFYFRLCHAGHALLYAPDAFVWHRAKPAGLPLIRKVFYYAIGRGGLLARDVRTVRPAYLIPTFFLLATIFLPILGMIFPIFWIFWKLMWALYIAANVVHAAYMFARFEHSIPVAAAIFFATPMLHFSYGMGVMWGVLLYIMGNFGKGGIGMWSKD